jgi:hypothetical protein
MLRPPSARVDAQPVALTAMRLPAPGHGIATAAHRPSAPAPAAALVLSAFDATRTAG